MRRNIGRLPLRNVPTGIGRLAQVLSKQVLAAIYVKREAWRGTLEGERAPFGTGGAGFWRGFRITDGTNAYSTIYHQVSKISFDESVSIVHFTSHVATANVVQTK